jgi:Sigma-70 region 2/Sigma-70, region 4
MIARRNALLRTAYLLTGDHHDAEDLGQSALIKVVPKWARIKDRPEPYVRRVLARESVNRRRGRRWREATTDVVPEAMQHDSTDHIALLEDLRRLSPRQRAVLVLRYFDDLTEADTAALSASPWNRQVARPRRADAPAHPAVRRRAVRGYDVKPMTPSTVVARRTLVGMSVHFRSWFGRIATAFQDAGDGGIAARDTGRDTRGGNRGRWTPLMGLSTELLTPGGNRSQRLPSSLLSEGSRFDPGRRLPETVRRIKPRTSPVKGWRRARGDPSE